MQLTIVNVMVADWDRARPNKEKNKHTFLFKYFLRRWKTFTLPLFLPAEISDLEERKEARLDRRQRGIILSTVRSLSTVLVPGKG